VCYYVNVSKVFSHVVSLHADLRPLTSNLNRLLEIQGAPPVRKDELAEVDDMLHRALADRAGEGTRCPRCHGYASLDGDGDLICLNCGRPAMPNKQLDDVVVEIAEKLLDYRRQQPNGA